VAAWGSSPSAASSLIPALRRSPCCSRLRSWIRPRAVARAMRIHGTCGISARFADWWRLRLAGVQVD